MSVEIGDELHYNLLPELEGQVVVINWQKLQWFTYKLDEEARDLFQEKGNKEDTVVMVVLTSYPHAFFFMVDFRIFLLNTFISTHVKQDCQKVNNCQKIPDLFTVLFDKRLDSVLAVHFYPPVFEYLVRTDESTSASFKLWLLERRNYALLAVLIMFVIVCLPLTILTYNLVKYYMKKDLEETEVNAHSDDVIKEETNCNGIECKCTPGAEPIADYQRKTK